VVSVLQWRKVLLPFSVYLLASGVQVVFPFDLSLLAGLHHQFVAVQTGKPALFSTRALCRWFVGHRTRKLCVTCNDCKDEVGAEPLANGLAGGWESESPNTWSFADHHIIAEEDDIDFLTRLMVHPQTIRILLVDATGFKLVALV
jgi:hypothetical protein